jgi:hypothetical protein
MPRKRILTHQEIAEKADRLIHLIEFSKINRKELCKDTGIKPDTLYRWMSGRLQGIGPSGARSLLGKLREFGVNCSEDWLLFGEGEPPFRTSFIDESMTAQPSFSSIHKSPESSPFVFSASKEVQKEIDFFHRSYPKTLGTFLLDDAMSPIFTQGDYVAGVQTEDFSALFGHFCLVQLQETEAILACRLEPGSEAGCFSLLSLNPTSKRPLLLLNQSLKAAARIIWRRSP